MLKIIMYIAFDEILMYNAEKGVSKMCNNLYLSNLPNDLYISNINLAGSHDSATAFVDFKTWAKCQHFTIKEQLDIGVRLLDIRLCYENGKFPLIHSVANCYADSKNKKRLYFEDVFNDCLKFLNSNPLETIVMSVKMDRGFRKNHFASAFYNSFISGKEHFWYLDDKIPTLKEVRGKVVLMRRFVNPYDVKNNEYVEKCGLDFSVWENQKTKMPVPPFTTYIGGNCFATVQDCYNLTDKLKWSDAIKPFLDKCKTTKDSICFHCLNTSGGKGVPLKNADYINEKFFKYKLNEKQGWFLVDFSTETLVNKIVKSNNLILE